MVKLNAATAALVVGCSAWAVGVNAAECTSYSGQSVTPITLDELMSVVSKLPNVKDEFETTQAFEARVASATAGMDRPHIVWIPLDPKYINYDADARTLSVKIYALSNEMTDYYGVFGYGTPYHGKIKTSTLGSHINVVVRRPEERDGSFTAQNSFGAVANVTRVIRRTQALFEREGGSWRGFDLSA